MEFIIGFICGAALLYYIFLMIKISSYRAEEKRRRKIRRRGRLK
tara:strand:+ start:556 stop:687 length:132 start_codon:yes stop_codon:yes gene_type:complete